MSDLSAVLDQAVVSMKWAEIDVPVPTPTAAAMPVVQFTERKKVAQIPIEQWSDLVTAIHEHLDEAKT